MASLQQVVEQLVLLAAASTNGTNEVNATSAPRGPLDLMTSTFKMLFSASALRDWAVLLVIGSLFETARRLLAALWYWLINSFFITAVFEEEDVSYQWIMHWLSKQPSWKGARNVQISTSNFDLHGVQIDSNEDPGAHSRKVTYLPAVSESYTLWYNYRWMRVTRAIESHRGGWSTRETLTISIMTRDHGVLTGILQGAKQGYIEAQKDKITIFVSDRYNRYFVIHLEAQIRLLNHLVDSANGWRELATRPKRPLNSIILDPGISDLVVEDVQDFLSSKEWYAERGIPFRRGYLLYGAPGSGKTSLIHSIAGELGLNVYIVSLSRSGLDDTGLSELISALPERCIALMEDIDAAFHHGLSRESPHPSPTQTSDDPDQQRDMQHTGLPAPTSNRVSLSGLLNALDGIGAQEGRVLFATTNKYSSLDPALCRPGRMDLHIEFKLASQFQAEELFKRFYAPPSSSSGSVHLTESKHATATEESDSPGPAYVGVSHRSRAPTLSLDRINKLSVQFALAVPERQLSMASLQGFLMMHKTRPFGAVADIVAWVEKELSERKRAEKMDEAG
ncbi:hypothetical protein J3R83DRAFT_8510 [Lanmaoa asiatica]|nr:hypothetical protein J3R83DRAFT_8510 [Lanmaoa asiatica]